MKKNLLKKAIAMILALVMTVTSLSWDGIIAMAQETTTQEALL